MNINQNNYNFKIIGIIIIFSLIILSTVGVGGVILYQTFSDTDEQSDDEFGLYASIPENTNFVVQSDIIGLSEDQITRDIANELHYHHMNQSQNWYDTTINNQFDNINREINEDVESDIDINIKKLEKIMIFGSYDENIIQRDNITSLDNEVEEEFDAGLLLKIDLNKEDIHTLVEDEFMTNVNSYEYNEYIVYEDEDVHITVLDNGVIAISNKESYMIDIIDTYNEENKHIKEELIPDDYNNKYISISLNNADIIHEEFINSIDEGTTVYDELNDNEKNKLQELKDLPTPQTIIFSYNTDDVEEVQFNTKVTFDTLEAASEVNRYFDASNENITTDITLDTTTVIFEHQTTSDYIIKNMKKGIEEYDSFLSENTNTEQSHNETDSSENDVFADIDIIELDDSEELKIKVIENKLYSQFIIFNPDGEIVEDKLYFQGQSVKVPEISTGDYTVVGINVDTYDIIINGTYELTNADIDNIMSQNNYIYNDKIELIYIPTTDKIELIISNNDNYDEFIVVDSNGNEQEIGESQIQDKLELSTDGSYVIIGVENDTKKALNTINAPENEFDTYFEEENVENNIDSDITEDETSNDDSNETENIEDEDISSTTVVTEEELEEDNMIEFTVEDNEFVSEFRIIDPDNISYIMDSEIGTTEQYPKVEDGSYSVIAIRDDGSEEVIETIE